MSSPAPGWYADPSGAPGLRWWDGAQWTEHVHVAEAAAVPMASVSPVPGATASASPVPGATASVPEPKKTRRRWVPWVVVTSVVVVLALVGTFAIVGLRSFLGLDRQFALPTAAEPVEGRGYAMTEPLLEIDTRGVLTFPADYDFETRTAENGGKQSWAFELFIDPALTARAGLFITQDGGQVQLRPFESETALAVDGSRSEQVLPDDAKWESWGIEPEYYLVRHIDERGEQLDTPVVTKFTAKSAMETARPVADVDAQTGSMSLRWEPVAGATKYIVIGAYGAVTDDLEFRNYTVLGTTTDTQWSSVEDVDSLTGDPYPNRQNTALRLFDDQSADDMRAHGAFPDDGYQFDRSGFRWGVIATDEQRYSPLASVDASAVIGGLPYEIADYAMSEAGVQGMMIDSLEDMPYAFPFTGLDGRTRTAVSFIPEAGITPTGHGWNIDLMAVGTQLGMRIEWWTDTAPADPEAFRAEFNAKAAAAAPTTGLGAFALASGTLEEVEVAVTPVSEPAQTEYPTYGSDDYVRFIAGHIVAGTEYIDISRYAAAPGAQDVWDAVWEAVYQNPYAVGYDRGGFAVRGTDVLHVTYTLSEDERASIQRSIHDGVQGVLSTVVNDGMTDQQKAQALNDWIAGKATYDDAAFATSQAGGSLDGLEYAWRADGIFANGTAVCLGYAEAYSALMNASGIPTVVVTGDVLAGGAHAWNKVQLDGTWFAVDPTWNDSPDPNRFLLIGDSQFTGSAERIQDAQWVRDDLVGAYTTP